MKTKLWKKLNRKVKSNLKITKYNNIYYLIQKRWDSTIHKYNWSYKAGIDYASSYYYKVLNKYDEMRLVLLERYAREYALKKRRIL